MNLNNRIRLLEKRVREIVCPWHKTPEGQRELLCTMAAMELVTCPPGPDKTTEEYRVEMLAALNRHASECGWASITDSDLETVFQQYPGQLAYAKDTDAKT